MCLYVRCTRVMIFYIFFPMAGNKLDFAFTNPFCAASRSQCTPKRIFLTHLFAVTHKLITNALRRLTLRWGFDENKTLGS